MSDRLKGVTVVFDSDIRAEDAQVVIDAIRQLRCVEAVLPVEVVPNDRWARMRVQQEFRERFWKMISGD